MIEIKKEREMTQESRTVVNMSLTEQKLENLYRRGVFFIPGAIEDSTAMIFFLDALTHELNDISVPIWLIINSPGGVIDQGFAVYDTIKMLVESGRTVNTVGFGEVASMALCVLQAGTKRYSFPNTQFTVHQASIVSGGDGEQVEVNNLAEDAAELKRMNSIILKILSDRCGMDMKRLRRLSKKTDHTIDAQKAKEFGKNGLIDEIITTLPFLNKNG